MQINSVEIIDTFAEAFPMVGTRLVITAATPAWALNAARVGTGYASSVIACDAEAGIERVLSEQETADGRPGVAVLMFAFSREKLEKAVANRVGQCVMTCATTACYNGLPGTEKKIKVGAQLRFFGDGHQQSKVLDGRRLWRVPVMDGEFVCESTFGSLKGIAGGNFLILGETQRAALTAAEQAVEAINAVPDAICPFPGGIVRSGSKVGSKYKKLVASTNDAYCPTLKGTAKTALPESVNAVYEIVIDALTEDAVRAAMRVGIQAACQPGVVQISAGNYGGNLGPHHFHLREVMG